MLGVAIWALVVTPTAAVYVQMMIGAYSYHACAALLLIFSVMMIAFGIVGCRGALTDDRKCLIAVSSILKSHPIFFKKDSTKPRKVVGFFADDLCLLDEVVDARLANFAVKKFDFLS